MYEEREFFRGRYGEILKRREASQTFCGIMIQRGKDGRWFLDFPDETSTSATTLELINLIYFLQKTNGDLDTSKQWVGFK